MVMRITVVATRIRSTFMHSFLRMRMRIPAAARMRFTITGCRTGMRFHGFVLFERQFHHRAWVVKHTGQGDPLDILRGFICEAVFLRDFVRAGVSSDERIMSDDLDEKLRAWKVDVQTPTTFHADVWRRIAAREAVREQSFPAWLASIFASLARPRWALAFAAVMLFAGVAAAHFEAHETNSDVWQNLQTRYVSSIDPAAHALAMR